MALDESDYIQVKRIAEASTSIAESLEGFLPDDDNIDKYGIAIIIGEGLHSIAKAIDRLTAAIEKQHDNGKGA